MLSSLETTRLESMLKALLPPAGRLVTRHMGVRHYIPTVLMDSKRTLPKQYLKPAVGLLCLCRKHIPQIKCSTQQTVPFNHLRISRTPRLYSFFSAATWTCRNKTPTRPPIQTSLYYTHPAGSLRPKLFACQINVVDLTYVRKLPHHLHLHLFLS